MNKIAHISMNYDLKIASGILSNAKAKLKALKKLGINNVDFYLINDFINDVDNSVKLVKLNHKNHFLEFYNKLFNKYALIKQVINMDLYDKIIIRYPFADKSMLDLVKNHNVYFEFHSTIESDIESYFKLDHPNRILMRINGSIRLVLERLYSNKIYGYAKGFLPVTDEIRRVESKNSNIDKFKTISNGVDTELYKTCKFKLYDGKQINMIMISSMDAYWHGVERLIDSIDNYNGKINFNLYIVGNYPVQNYRFKNNKNNIIFTGKLNEIEISSMLGKMNLGIGTLGLHKKNLNEASILKVREYVSHGIPFIKAYYDTDIDNMPELNPYFLNFPNDDSLLDIEKILEFLKNISQSELDISEKMHQIAVEKLDWTIKMKEYVDFINNE